VKYGDKALSSFLNRKLRIKKVKAIGIVTSRPAMKIFRNLFFSFGNNINAEKSVSNRKKLSLIPEVLLAQPGGR
jgi:hypothetical protein